jgi:hypothetical protein
MDIKLKSKLASLAAALFEGFYYRRFFLQTYDLSVLDVSGLDPKILDGTELDPKRVCHRAEVIHSKPDREDPVFETV